MNPAMKLILSAAPLLILSACSSIQPKPESELVHLYDYRWSLPADPQRDIGTDRVAEILQDYDAVFFGELHNHPGTHLAQMDLFAGLYGHNNRLA
jgi:uncharacterized iron-regulated protein